MGSLYESPYKQIPRSTLTNKCIVIDLDQTLISTQDDIEDLKVLKVWSDPVLHEIRKRTYHLAIEDVERPGIGSIYEFWGIIRPHTREFLLFCFSYFSSVIIWSAGKRQYVEAIVDYLFRDLPAPHAIFTHDEIKYLHDNTIIKPLSMIFSVVGRGTSLDNTLALDDNPTTFSENGDNALFIPEYNASSVLQSLYQEDFCLLKLKKWLLRPDVLTCKNVRSLDKESIFS